mgnify:CR=1 FL=1
MLVLLVSSLLDFGEGWVVFISPPCDAACCWRVQIANAAQHRIGRVVRELKAASRSI